MIAVILAAGSGTRLSRAQRCPKPLLPVLGLSLAERVICTYIEDLGVPRFLVVLGHEAEVVKAHFQEIARRRKATIDFVIPENWRLGNGASALAAKRRVHGDSFYLSMVDHLFDPKVARRLAAALLSKGEIALAVDRNKNGVFDIGDVTRVRMDMGRLVEIGKNLEVWDAADTGVFLCTGALFDGLELAGAKGCHALSDGIRELSRQGRAVAVDVSGMDWLDIDTPAALREAERRLLQRERGKASDGPVSRYLNRPLSRLLSRYLVRVPITPNQISVGSWLMSCAAAAMFATGGYLMLVLGGVVAQLASIVDGCDGEIARLKRMRSDFGGWFDAVLDRYADAFLLFGLTWHAYMAEPDPVALVVGFAAIVGSFVSSYTADKYDGLMARRIRRGFHLRLGRDVRVFIICLGALLNLPLVALAVIAFLMNAEVIRRIVICRRAIPA